MAKPLSVNGSKGDNIMKGFPKRNTMKKDNLILGYMGHHPEYETNRIICTVCGTPHNIAGKIIYEGDGGSELEGKRFEFPICTNCFLEDVEETIAMKDAVEFQYVMERENRRIAEQLYPDPFC